MIMDKNFRIRLGVSFLLVALLGLGVLIRAGQLMLVPSERLSTAMNRQFRPESPRIPRRGYILDRNNEPIAVSMEVKSLFANPGKIENKNHAASLVAKALGLPVQAVRAKLKGEKGFVWIKRQLNEVELAAVEEMLDQHHTLALTLGLAKESKRFYPNQSLAAQLMGFTGLDSNGLEGVELRYEKELAGESTKEVFSDGRTLVLTIDKNLQYTLEEELERGLKDTGGIAATAMVMDADTGDIIAMGSAPTFNANRYSATAPEFRRNRSVTDTYEPGSTMKPLLLAGALEENVVNTKTKIYCEMGRMQIGKHWVNEAEAKDKWGWLRVGEVMQKSSNVGATKIGFLYGEARTYKWYKRLGITEKSGIDLPGEAAGVLPAHEKWSRIGFSNISFGQGVSVTPIQMLRAYAALANGGTLVTPRLLKRVHSFEGEFLRELPIGKQIRVMEKKTAVALTAMLATVPTEDGTAPKAAIPGFIIAGKTGTAQKPIPGRGYRSGKHIASFIGYAKGVKPNYVVFVMVDEPKFPYFGGEAAAPIFKRIMTAALANERVAPDPSLLQKIELGKKEPEEIREKIVQISAAPAPPVGLAKNAEDWLMPNLSGVTARDALDLFSGLGLNVKIRGGGVVKEQSPAPGTKLQKGDAVLLRLERGTEAP